MVRDIKLDKGCVSMSWFDILKEPLISVPKSIVSMKKPKKIETSEDCKERIKAFLNRLDAFCDEVEKVAFLEAANVYTEIANMKETVDGLEEEDACKVLEEIRAIEVKKIGDSANDVVKVWADKTYSSADMTFVMRHLHGKNPTIGRNPAMSDLEGIVFTIRFHTFPEPNGKPDSWKRRPEKEKFAMRKEYTQKLLELMKSA